MINRKLNPIRYILQYYFIGLCHIFGITLTISIIAFCFRLVHWAFTGGAF